MTPLINLLDKLDIESAEPTRTLSDEQFMKSFGHLPQGNIAKLREFFNLPYNKEHLKEFYNSKDESLEDIQKWCDADRERRMASI